MSFQQLPVAASYGYEIDVNNKLQPKLMNLAVSASELLNKLICACTDNMRNVNCTCLLSNDDDDNWYFMATLLTQ